tara:strand:+ start:817 stop:2352 length:1536 start_codon:yes stop_codon:yes gene_type:complete
MFDRVNISESNKIILVEFNRLASSIISYSYLVNVLSKKYNANVVAYRLTAKKNWIKDFIWKLISKLFFLNTFQVYKSFGTKTFICPNNINLDYKYEKRIKIIVKKIKNKNDLLNLKVDNIYIGDLIYDSYLMNFKQPTIDIKNNDFFLFLDHSLRTFFQWNIIFNKYKVTSVIVSHSVYTLAIPLRIAISKEIPSFQCSSQHLYKLSKKNIYAYREFFEYKRMFKKINKKVKKRAIFLAKKKINKKFSGNDLALGSTISAYKKVKLKRIIKKTKNIKVLIATHCFFDNPHPYGKNLFVDFHEWLDYLGKISKKTDYDWYIKLHPDYLKGTKDIIRTYLNNYPNITYVPSKYSHHQLIDEGIDVALTCWGSIAHEYPLFNKLVVNSSINNPHINYKFSLNPKNIKVYKNILYNLKKYLNSTKKNDIYEFYAMNFILKKNWLIDNLNFMISNNKYGYYFQFKPPFYDYWIKKEFNQKKHTLIQKDISKFLKSNDYLINWNKIKINNFFNKNAK